MKIKRKNIKKKRERSIERKTKYIKKCLILARYCQYKNTNRAENERYVSTGVKHTEILIIYSDTSFSLTWLFSIAKY